MAWRKRGNQPRPQHKRSPLNSSLPRSKSQQPPGAQKKQNQKGGLYINRVYNKTFRDFLGSLDLRNPVDQQRLFDWRPPQFHTPLGKKRRKGKRRAKARSVASSQQDAEPQATGAVNSTACHRAFATTELAEAIFLELTMSDILCGVIQTCKNWNTVVENSTKLQQALFFKPIPIKPLQFSFQKKGWVTPGNEAKHKIYEHPLLAKLNSLALDMHITRSLAGDLRMSPEIVLDAVKKRAHPASKSMHRANASWRRALVSQPPIIDVYSDGDGESHLIARNERGVVMGDVIPVIRSKRRTEIQFHRPALKLRGYNTMVYYTGYNQLRNSCKQRSPRKLRDEVHGDRCCVDG